jgi:hypothetical protein
MKFSISLILTLLISISACASNNDAECSNIKPNTYFGSYSVLSEEKYTASIRDIRKINTSRNGQHTTINADLFEHQDIKLDNPTYKVTCKDINNTEGEVTTNKHSNFYGYANDRKEIRLINIYDSNSGELEYSFEIVKNELWDLYDGWIYKYQQ